MYVRTHVPSVRPSPSHDHRRPDAGHANIQHPIHTPHTTYDDDGKQQQEVASIAVEEYEGVPNLALKKGVDEIALIEARKAQSGGSDVRMLCVCVCFFLIVRLR